MLDKQRLLEKENEKLRYQLEEIKESELKNQALLTQYKISIEQLNARLNQLLG